MTSRDFDKRNGMDGPAFLLGRTDWLDLYTQLAAATWRARALFTGGLAGIGAVRQAASQRAKAAGLSPGTTEFLSQLTNTALSAPLYAGLAPAMLGATHLAGAATRSIQNAVD